MTLTPLAPTTAFIVGPHSVISHNGIVFNDRSTTECYWVTEFGGFDAADLRLSSEENTQEDGELAGPGFRDARVMTMTGAIRAGSYTKYLEMARALLDAYSGPLVETPMLIRPATGSTIFAHPEMQIGCRLSDKPQVETALRESDLRGMIKRPFTIALKAHKQPMYESVVEHYDDLVPTAISQLGRVYDRTYDLVYETFLDSSGNPALSGNSITVHNDGNYGAKPVIRFTGSMSGISLINETNGHRINLKHSIADGEYIEVDVREGRVRNHLGENAMATWDLSSDWLELDGKRGGATGDNVLSLLVDSFSGSPKVEIWWRDTIN